MSDLQKFCREVLAAIKLPEKDQPSWFYPDCGLCTNADSFDCHFVTTKVYFELKEEFEFYYLENRDFPFNIDCYQYYNESDRNEIYENEKRLAFLREHAKD